MISSPNIQEKGHPAFFPGRLLMPEADGKQKDKMKRVDGEKIYSNSLKANDICASCQETITSGIKIYIYCIFQTKNVSRQQRNKLIKTTIKPGKIS